VIRLVRASLVMITSWTWLSRESRGVIRRSGPFAASPRCFCKPRSHSCLHTAMICKMLFERSAEGHPALDAFPARVSGTFNVILHVPVPAAFFHGLEGSHAAIDLVASALKRRSRQGSPPGAAKKTAIITQCAPAPRALVMSPEYLIPMAMMGMPYWIEAGSTP